MYDKYVSYLNKEYYSLNEDELLLFIRYNKQKGFGFTYMQYKEFEELIKIEEEIKEYEKSNKNK